MRKWLLAFAICSLTAASFAAQKKPAAAKDGDASGDPSKPAKRDDASKPAPQTKPATKPATKVGNDQAGKGIKPWPAPPVPALSPEEMLKTFKLPPGLRIEIVAAEPMIDNPVAMAFDADGRLWVVEMRAYMPDPSGKGEDAPTGRVSVLEDTDGDGRMDKSTVFLDGLVVPRAIGFARDGVLIGAPPHVLFCRDTNGDLKCDEQTPITADYGGRGNPEHQPNGLVTGLDNWIYSANYSKRLRSVPASPAGAPATAPAGDKWLSDPTTSRGQWGFTQDDVGRPFYNSNSSELHADLFPARYGLRNTYYPVAGLGGSIAGSKAIFPAIPTIANRGYGNIVKDGFLQSFTGACGPGIYRGGLLGAEYQGNAFVCEPVGCFVRRDIITESPEGKLSAKNPHEKDKLEFLTSTNERFRPVNTYTGPEGALYIVDMHHGLLQHRVFLTDFARRGYLERKLEERTDMGRIYRIVPEAVVAKDLRPPKLSKLTGADLVTHLASPNGWVRDTAQRLIVDRQDASAVAPLRKLIASAGGTPLARIHALWALEGLKRADLDTVTAALADTEPKVRAAALRVAEQLLSNPAFRNDAIPEVLKLAADSDPTVRLQFCLTAGEIGTNEAMDALAAVLTKSADNPLVRDAVISGLRGREDDFVERLLSLPAWAKSAPGRAQLLTGLAQCVFAASKERQVTHLLDLAAAQPPSEEWRTVALLDGVAAAAKAKKLRKPFQTDKEPEALAKLERATDPKIRASLKAVSAQVIWPGKPGYKAPPPIRPLTPDEQTQFDQGKVVYAAICAACHQPDGEGQPGLAPPLVDSEWVLSNDKRLARIVLNGLTGPIKVDDQNFNLEMPPLKTLPDDQITAVLTYIRREWDHGADPVKPETVKQIRDASADRELPYTVKELSEIKD